MDVNKQGMMRSCEKGRDSHAMQEKRMSIFSSSHGQTPNLQGHLAGNEVHKT